MTGSRPPTEEPPPDTPATFDDDRRPSLGTILFGGFLILFGILWLLDRTGTVELSWSVLLPGILVAVGLAVIVESRQGSHDGLITIGVILSIVLTLTNLSDINLDPSIGDNDARPATVEELKSEYNLGIGQQTLDLTQIKFPPGETTLEASVGIGDLVVMLPEGVGARIKWNLGAGEVTVFGDEVADGVGQDGEQMTPNFDSADQRVTLDLSVGIGNIEVIQ